MSKVSRATEKAARASYGKILAYLSTRTHDIAAAEDALAEAFAKALGKWPEDGVPSNPDAWLLTVARNQLTDQQRHATRFPSDNEIPELVAPENKLSALKDERLALMMVCVHPAIAQDLHTPLMLQTVLGIEAKHIAKLYLISPSALSKRLVRAKVKIREAGIPFHIPDAERLHERSCAIFEAIYALHAHDWLAPADGMGEEALYLANLLCEFMSDNAEALGLSALIAFNHARRDARIVEGVLVPTQLQDMKDWDDELIAYGNQQLHKASKLSKIGRFQLEAAIDSVHLARKETGKTDWTALSELYYGYLKMSPSAGAAVSHAVVSANLHGAEVGLLALAKLEDQIGSEFQPIWAARAELLSRTSEIKQAALSYEKAIELSDDAPVIRFLKNKMDGLLES